MLRPSEQTSIAHSGFVLALAASAVPSEGYITQHRPKESLAECGRDKTPFLLLDILFRLWKVHSYTTFRPLRQLRLGGGHRRYEVNVT